MKKIISIIAVLCVIFSCQQSYSQKKDSSTKVSMINLISSPEEYHGKKIRVNAYLKIKHESNAIYLNKDDYRYSIYKNAIYLYVDRDKLEKFLESPYEGYVSIEGIFNKNDKGHLSLFSGSLSNVTNIYRLSEKKDVP